MILTNDVLNAIEYFFKKAADTFLRDLNDTDTRRRKFLLFARKGAKRSCILRKKKKNDLG